MESKWPRLITILGAFLVFRGFWKIPKTLGGISQNVQVLLFFFFFVSTVHVLLGIPQYLSSYPFMDLIFSKTTLWLYLIIFTLLIPFRLIDLVKVKKFATIYILTSLTFSLYFFNDLFINPVELITSMSGFDAYIVNRPQEPALLLTPFCVFLVIIPHINKKVIILFYFAAIFALVAAMLAGRRSTAFLLFVYLILPFFIVLTNRKGAFVKTIMFVVLGSSLLLSRGFSTKSIETRFENSFVILANRMNTDTRSDTEKDFVKDMKSMSDWIWGRGMAGTYYSPSVAGFARVKRQMIETGFFNIILHGGLIMLIPYITLLLFAFYKGYFYSNSLFVKTCAVFCLIHFFTLYPGGTPALTLEYFMVFAFIRICLTPTWLSYKDSEICCSLIGK